MFLLLCWFPVSPSRASDCLFLGGSIAQGVHAASVNAGFRYLGVTRVGASTKWIAGHATSAPFRWVVLSAGSNDYSAPELESRLVLLRSRVGSARVVWILPRNRRAAGLVAGVASRYGDRTLDLINFSSADRIHPRDYRSVFRGLLPLL